MLHIRSGLVRIIRINIILDKVRYKDMFNNRRITNCVLEKKENMGIWFKPVLLVC